MEVHAPGPGAEGNGLPKTSWKSLSQSVFCGTSPYCVVDTMLPLEHDGGNSSSSSHVKIFPPKSCLNADMFKFTQREAPLKQ